MTIVPAIVRIATVLGGLVGLFTGVFTVFAAATTFHEFMKRCGRHCEHSQEEEEECRDLHDDRIESSQVELP